MLNVLAICTHFTMLLDSGQTCVYIAGLDSQYIQPINALIDI